MSKAKLGAGGIVAIVLAVGGVAALLIYLYARRKVDATVSIGPDIVVKPAK